MPSSAGAVGGRLGVVGGALGMAGHGVVWPTGDPGLSYDDEVLADTPAGYWPMQGASAAAAVDVVAGRNLTWNGSPTFAESGPGGAQSVRFTGGVMQGRSTASGLPTLADTSMTGCSVETWFRWSSGTSFAAIAALRAGGAAAESAILAHNSASAGQARSYRAGSFRTSGAGSLNDGAWHHRVDIYDPAGSGLSAVYVDGALLQSAAGLAAGANLGDAYVVVGGNYATIGGAVQGFTGWVCRTAVYAHPLPPARIAAHYAAGH